MNNENFKKFFELLKADKALAEGLHNALLDEELDQVNAAAGTGTGKPVWKEVPIKAKATHKMVNI